MLFGVGLLSLATLCLLVYCTLEVVTTPESDVRHLPKPLWLVLVLFFPLVGGIAWLVAGRPLAPRAAGRLDKGNRGVPPEYDRPGRAVARSPDDDEAFLRQVRERAQAQRRAAEEQRRAERAAEEHRRAAEREARRARRDAGGAPQT